MKSTNTCPKCGSTDIATIPRQVTSYGAGVPCSAGMKIWGVIDITRFMCCGCGFTEEWIEDPKDIDKIKKKFGKEAV